MARSEQAAARRRIVAVDVGAFVDGAAHLFVCQSGAERSNSRGVTHLRHSRDIDHPRPRKFTFRDEFFVQGTGPDEAVREIRKQLAGRDVEHVVNIFSSDPQTAISAYAPHGYRPAWTTALMARDLGDIDPASNSGEARAMQGQDDLELVHRLREDSSDTLEVETDSIRNLMVTRGGEAVAKAQLIVAKFRRGYVSTMFTHPDHRRSGWCKLLMTALHREAVAQGATRSILVPSLMAEQINLYERYGYAASSPMTVLIPNRP